MADPWLKFYTSDWRADPRLKMCSPAARGMWIEMICLMHEASPYGHLLIHGQTPNEAQLASLTGISAAELPHLVAELERLGVFSRTKEGVIYSRKLVRMASRSAVARKNGKKGGNPSLGKGKYNSSLVNLPDKGDVKPQIPEAIYQKDSEANASAADGGEPDEDLAKTLFNRCVSFLAKHGSSERHARSIVGLWRKTHPDPEIIDAFTACSKAGAVDPIPWITARLGGTKIDIREMMKGIGNA